MIVTYKRYNGETHRANMLKCFLLFILNSYRNYTEVDIMTANYMPSVIVLFSNLYPLARRNPSPEVGWE